METVKNILALFALMLILIGFVWAIIALAGIKEWIALVGVVLLGLAATPTIVALVKRLIPGKETK